MSGALWNSMETQVPEALTDLQTVVLRTWCFLWQKTGARKGFSGDEQSEAFSRLALSV